MNTPAKSSSTPSPSRKLTRALYVIYGSADLLMEEISVIGARLFHNMRYQTRLERGMEA